VERLDLLSLGFARAQAAFPGRPAYDPRALLKLSLYGDLNRLSASRRLEREPHRQVEFLWLLRKLRPDFKPIADFRTKNPTALHALFRECVLLCKQLDLCGAALLAIAGSTCKAVNHHHKHCTPATLEQALKDLDAKVEPDLRDLDAADREESNGHQPTREELQKKMESLPERQQRDRGCVEEIPASGAPQLSLTAPDSRSLSKSPKVEVGYHVQIAVDSQPKLSVAQEVTHAVPADDQLRPMAIRAQETLGVERIRAVADRGDDHGQESTACAEGGIDADMPQPATSANTKLGRFGKERFTSDPQKDC